MSHFIIGDLVHPDTFNLWLELSGLASLEEIVLYRQEGDDWLAIVPGYVKGPVLRRLTHHTDGWRHFPMKPWPDNIAPHCEIDGALVVLKPVPNMPTWLLEAAIKADFRLLDRVAYLGSCLEIISDFSRFSYLRQTSAQLEQASRNRLQRSCVLNELLGSAHRVFSKRSHAFSEWPSASHLLNMIDDVLQSISNTSLDIVFPTQVQQQWLDGLLALFEPTSPFEGGPQGESIAIAKNWHRQNKVRLVPRRLSS